MFVKFARIICLVSIFISFLFNFTTPSFAQTPQDWGSVPGTGGRCVKTVTANGKTVDVATIQGFECVFYNILQVIVIVAGLVFLFMFITGGFQYLMSSNDPKAVAQATSTLTMAFIGVVGILLSWFVLNFIANFTGLPVLDFIIPGP